MNKQIKLFNILGLVLVMTSLLFTSCDPENVFPDQNTGDQFNNTELTSATFIGQIIKEDGSPLDGAVVRTGNHQITTDADGFFYFNDISTPKNATLISVQKIGYFNAHRTMRVIPNQDNQTKIMVMELPAPEVFNAASGGLVTIANGGSINFPANAIVDKFSNQPYTGSVNVFAKWIDPTSGDISLLMPGALRGINEEGAEEGLTTYGMQAVELVGDAGQPLQIASGNQAELKFPLPGSIVGNAPADVPLWSLNEQNGMWVEEGKAVKQGNEYVAQVSHFSFWNCDYGGPIVGFTCTLVDNNNNPISGAWVTLDPTSNNQLGPRSATTNSNGVVSGSLPVNTTFDLNFIPTGCNWSSPSTFVQTFSSTNVNINLGTITVNNTTAPTVVSGTVHDCNNNILVNAIVKIKIGYNVQSVTTNASGQFSQSINCLSAPISVDISAYDPINAVNGNLNTTLTPGVVNNVGVLQACGTQNDFISCTGMNGAQTISYSIVEPAGSFNQAFNNNRTGVSGIDNIAYSYFEFDGPQTVAGTHNLVTYYDGNDSLTTISPAIVNLTNYATVGGKIEGSFNTTVNGQVYNGATLNVNFRVTRQQ